MYNIKFICIIKNKKRRQQAVAFSVLEVIYYFVLVFSVLPMLVNAALRSVEKVLRAAMIAAAIRAAMSEYSIAVAPDSSLAKRVKMFMVLLLLLSGRSCGQRCDPKANDEISGKFAK